MTAAMNARRPESSIRPMLVVGGGIVGGVESHVLALVTAFAARGVRPLVVAPFAGDFTQALADAGHPVEDTVLVEMSDRVNVAALAQLVWLCRTRAVSVVHSHMRGADLVAVPAAYTAGVPALSTLHGLERYPEELSLRHLFGVSYVAVSEAGRQSAGDLGLDIDAIPVIHNGIDAARFDPARHDRAAARRALGLPPEAFVVAAIARLMPEKDPMAAIAVADRLAPSHPHLHLILAGTGTLEAQVRQAAGTRSYVTVLGSRPDVPPLMAASDVVLLTSKRESLPLVVLEAMAMEVPVAAFDVGGVGEAVTPMTGRLVPPGDVEALAEVVAALASDAALRRGLGVAGRAHVLRGFTHDRCAAAVLARYAALGRPGMAVVEPPQPPGAVLSARPSLWALS